MLLSIKARLYTVYNIDSQNNDKSTMIPILDTIVSHPRKIVSYIIIFIIMMGAQKTTLGATQDFVINNGRFLYSSVHSKKEFSK